MMSVKDLQRIDVLTEVLAGRRRVDDVTSKLMQLRFMLSETPRASSLRYAVYT